MTDTAIVHTLVAITVTLLWYFQNTINRIVGTRFKDEEKEKAFMNYRLPQLAAEAKAYRWLIIPVTYVCIVQGEFPTALFGVFWGVVLFMYTVPGHVFVSLCYLPFIVHAATLFYAIDSSFINIIIWVVSLQVVCLNWVESTCQFILLYCFTRVYTNNPIQHPVLLFSFYVYFHYVTICGHRNAFRFQCKATLAARTTEIVGVGLIVYDNMKKIISVNKAWCDITGYTSEEVVGRKAWGQILQGKDTSKNTIQHIKDAMAAQQPFSGTILHYQKNDTPFWNDITIQPVYINGHLRQYIGTIRDVTEKVENEKRKVEVQKKHATSEARHHAQRDITAYIFHEFRNDLQVVTSAVTFWIQGKECGDDLKQASLNCLHHCRDLINNMTELSKLKAGKLKMEQISFNLKNVCNKVHKTMVHAFPQVLKIYCTCPSIIVMGSPRHLTQVLQNLLSNACKNTPWSGTVKLVVEILSEAVDTYTVHFRVCDTGCGIPREEQENVFNEYVQVGAKNGTGMGLPLSKAIVHLSGGTLQLRSPCFQSTTGAEFFFDLTLDKGQEVVALAKQEPINLPDAWKVLVADDSLIVRKCVVRMLQQVNVTWTIDEAESGEKVLEMVGSNEYNLILIDENMTSDGLKGTDATQLMRDNGVTCLIFGLTGNESEEFNLVAKSKGQDYVFGKPFANADAFMQIVQGFLVRVQELDPP